jgi:NAD dependent epimerase/dehydratase family enzyme
MQMLGKTLRLKVIGTIPSFLAKRLFGELIEELTKSQQVQPRRLIDKGFTFTYPTLSSAFHAIFSKKK